MRILVVTNLYPPYYVGGYEVECRNVVEALKAKGHTIKILTSTYGIHKPQHDGEVYRWLIAVFGWETEQHHQPYYVELLKKEFINQRAFKRLCKAFNPEVIYVWNTNGISISLLFIGQRMGIPICYRISDKWLLHWERDPWCLLWRRRTHKFITQYGKKLFSFFCRAMRLISHCDQLSLRHVQFASHYIEQITLQVNKSVANSRVIPWGVDVKRYPYESFCHEPKRLLYVGQIIGPKGVQTAVEALRLIVEHRQYKSLKLTIVGGAIAPSYEDYIRHLVNSLGLENNISFTGLVMHKNLPFIYQKHDILIFPSTMNECFSSVLREAMASGLAVVSTMTGGNNECLEPEDNALIFSKEDAQGCAAQIQRLLKDQKLFDKIRHNGRRTMEYRFQFEDMIDKIESSLYDTIR